MSKDPQLNSDDFLDKYKSMDLNTSQTLKGTRYDDGSPPKRDMSFSDHINEKQRIQNQFNKNSILETCPMPDEGEVFYKKLRERVKMAEIQGPIKYKVHSSLERVYDTIKDRGKLDLDQKDNAQSLTKIFPVSDYSNSNKSGYMYQYKKRSITAQSSDQYPSQSKTIDIILKKQASQAQKVENQSIYLKNLIMPEIHQKKHFKAAQALISRNQGSLQYDSKDFDKRFKNLSNSSLYQVVLNKGINNESYGNQNEQKIHSLTKEMLKACNIIRDKKVDLQKIRYISFDQQQQQQSNSRLNIKEKLLN